MEITTVKILMMITALILDIKDKIIVETDQKIIIDFLKLNYIYISFLFYKLNHTIQFNLLNILLYNIRNEIYYIDKYNMLKLRMYYN